MTKKALSKEDLNKYRDILIKERQKLIAELNHDNNLYKVIDSGDKEGDLADHAFAHYEMNFLANLSQQQRNMLEQINNALDRIENGTYGICLASGKPIKKNRLKAIPWAAYSIEYAHLAEKNGTSLKPDMFDKSSE